MAIYVGTDGLRGEVEIFLATEHAYIVIGKDVCSSLAKSVTVGEIFCCVSKK